MFTLTRLLAALLLALFAAWSAGPYEVLYGADRPLRNVAFLLGGMGFAVGWSFLGGKARALWLSAYLGFQAVVLTGVLAAVLTAVRDIFSLGYQRQYSDAVEAVQDVPVIALNYLSKTVDTQFLITMGVGGVVLGIGVHLIDRALDRRRTAR